MARKRKRPSPTQLLIEQIALLLASFVWSTVVLSIIVWVWIFQDVESNWNKILGRPTPTYQSSDLALLLATSTPTQTPWAGPPPSTTPTETLTPSTTPTLVMKPPEILPETFNIDDPTPVTILVHAEDEIAAALPTAMPADGTERPPTATAAPPPPTPASQGAEPAAVETTPPPTLSPAPTVTPQPLPTPMPAAQLEGVPTRLVIPSVAIDSQVIPVTWQLVEQNGIPYSIWQVADYAVGWHDSSALPGYPGNTVMAGHHNINGEVFKNLVNVEVGDEVDVYVKDKILKYTIELKTIVKEKGEPAEVRQKNAEWIAATDDERLTMVTCWPYTNNTHRVIVVARPANSLADTGQ
jgi:sortase A